MRQRARDLVLLTRDQRERLQVREHLGAREAPHRLGDVVGVDFEVLDACEGVGAHEVVQRLLLGREVHAHRERAQVLQMVLPIDAADAINAAIIQCFI